ncbi:glucose-1-phosphate adenylyltransferase [Alteromonas sp. D210916BOD_24]|uniref:glucose-1-phosphate adenylyltransferase n=1 Tax=Alteromonas sp. D210916BOD_24 TaxID=3157618 RepID=UPI00399CB484
MNTDLDIYKVMKDTLVLVLAGGQGSRLKDLTKTRAKPVLEFGSHCRIIDFPLSNCVNSGLHQIAVLTQYKSQCLIRHLMQHWGPLNSSFGGRLDILPASQQRSENWYQGTADACYQNLSYIKSVAPKYVLILSGDHVYNMDYRKLLTTHVRNDADMTVSCIEVPTQLAAKQLGVLSADEKGQITAFDEKPHHPHALIDAPDYCLASMGNYVVNTDVLLKLLCHDANLKDSDHDFGKNVIPSIIQGHRVFAHRFRTPNGDQIPYWRDVGTLDSYWQAHMDLLNNRSLLNLADPEWPIWGSSHSRSPTEITQDKQSPACELTQMLVGSGGQLKSCSVKQSVLSSNVKVNAEAKLDKCVVLPDVTIGKGAKLEKVIVDKGVTIPPHFVIENAATAKQQGFTVTRQGVILVTQNVIDKVHDTLESVDHLQRLLKSDYIGPLPIRPTRLPAQQGNRQSANADFS